MVGLNYIIRDTKNMISKNRAILTESIEKKAKYMWEQYLEFAPVVKEFEFLLRRQIDHFKEIEKCKR